MISHKKGPWEGNWTENREKGLRGPEQVDVREKAGQDPVSLNYSGVNQGSRPAGIKGIKREASN